MMSTVTTIGDLYIPYVHPSTLVPTSILYGFMDDSTHVQYPLQCRRNYVQSYSPLFHASLSTLFLLLVTKMLAYSIRIYKQYGVMTSNHPFSLVEKAYHANSKRATFLAYSARPRYVSTIAMTIVIFTLTTCYYKLSTHEEVK